MGKRADKTALSSEPGADRGSPPALLDNAPPRTLPNGKVNPDHLRWAIRQINDLNVNVALGTAELPRGYNLSQARELIETEAKLNGYDPKHLMDVRTDAQVYADSTEALIATPGELFSATDEVLEKIERQMDAADAHCGELLGGVHAEATRNAKTDREHAAQDAEKKKWVTRIKRIRRLRERARKPFPAGSMRANFHPISAAHVLRFMVYTGRSSLDGQAAVLQVGRHHAVIAAELYQAENKSVYQDLAWVPTECDGYMAVCPPGHGKTVLAAHWVVLRLAQNPRKTGLIGHAQAAEAEKDLAYVASYFDPGTANGRRVRSLFDVPGVATANSDTFDFKDVGDESKRQPTLKAHGMTAKISGADANFIWFDDPCDQELAEQETTRKRVFDRMNGTWRTRKRGNAFEFTTTTLWHHDDPNSRRIEMARHRKIKLRVCIQKCGGPEQGFKPLWPEVYPASFLKNKYAELRSPRLYAACYQSNPQPEELRKIKRLAYYLPGSKEHQRFMDAAIFHLSLDPSATNREKSDKAALIYAGVGDVVTAQAGAMVYDRRMRMLNGREFHANQTDGVNEVCSFAEINPVHYAHVEVRSGFNASAEMLEARGIDVLRHDPKNRKKELRLGDVAPMLDDSLKARGFPGAAIEFPGMLMDDRVTIGPDPDSPLAWLEKQILEFGVCVDDHGVDALTQLAKDQGPELGVGEGAVTRKVQEAAHEGDPRLARMLAYYGKPPDSRKTAAQEDYEFRVGIGEN